VKHLAEDFVFSAGEELADIVAGYWHLREGAERALECDIPDCHHQSVDREEIKTSYDRQLASICHQVMELLMDHM